MMSEHCTVSVAGRRYRRASIIELINDARAEHLEVDAAYLGSCGQKITNLRLLSLLSFLLFIIEHR